MPLRIYITPMIGAGDNPDLVPRPWIDTNGPWRVRVTKYLSGNDTYRMIDHPSRKIAICLVDATDSAHNQIDADPLIKPVTSRRASNYQDLAGLLSTPMSSYSSAWRNAAKTLLENNGYDCSWVTGSTTIRQLIAYVVRHTATVQNLNGRKLRKAMTLLTRGLDVTVSSIPTDERDEIKNFLQSRGVDLSWVTQTTTMREIVSRLAPNFAKVYGRDVPLRFAGEDT